MVKCELRHRIFGTYDAYEDYPIQSFILKSADIQWEKLVYEGFEKRFKDILKTQEEVDTYKERLNYEVDTIIKMGFVDYHMIVQDFINWAKDG